MKSTSIIKLSAIAALSFGAITPAFADLKQDAIQVYNQKKDSVVSVKGIMKLDVSMNGQVLQSQQMPIQTSGLTIAKGLVLVAYRSVSPDFSSMIPKNQAIDIESELEELKLVDGAGEEFDAKIILHDADLGIAFLAIDPEGENAKNFKSTSADLSKDVDLKHLDDVVFVSRLGEGMRYASGVKTGSISAIVEKPRKNYLATGLSGGSAVFSPKGELVGFTVVKTKEGSQQPTPFILPSKYVRKLVPQAKQKQATLTTES